MNEVPPPAGVSTQVAQSRIQECMATLSEHDYATITKQYKVRH